jgi:hypothetical protein
MKDLAVTKDSGEKPVLMLDSFCNFVGVADDQVHRK